MKKFKVYFEETVHGYVIYSHEFLGFLQLERIKEEIKTKRGLIKNKTYDRFQKAYLFFNIIQRVNSCA